MLIRPCNYWHEEDGGCRSCPADYGERCTLSIEKNELIENLKEAMENIQKMLDRLEKL